MRGRLFRDSPARPSGEPERGSKVRKPAGAAQGSMARGVGRDSLDGCTMTAQAWMG